MRLKNLIRLAVMAVCLGYVPSIFAATPVLSVIDQFTAADVPTTGTAEIGVPPRKVSPTTGTLPAIPGNGIAQHPMLYVGEGLNKLFLINEGKVIWTYSMGPKTGEIDDAWILSNGHVLVAAQRHVEEITPKKEVVWKYIPPVGTEVHDCQPIGLDKVMMIQNGLPPKVMIVNKKTGAVEVEHAMPALSATDQKTVHTQFRRLRVTAAGTYLAPFLKMNKVIEYDKDFKEIWNYDINNPWSAVRLHNGNTLITDERDRLTREVNPQKETVWEFKESDLPAGLKFGNTQTSTRLANGNTVITSGGGGGRSIQMIEVTPEKKAVWVLRDWKNLGPSTSVQFLDEPGVPETPGDLQR